MSLEDVANDPKYPFSKGQIRNHVAKRKTNGLATSIRKIGRRIYIREDLLEEWMESFKETLNVGERIDKFPVAVPLIDKNIDSHIEENPIEQGVKKMDIKIEDLELSVRAENCLRALDINTLYDIIEKTEEDFLECKSVGRKTLNEIKDKVMSMGFNLKEK